jgi:hypothetical protein
MITRITAAYTRTYSDSGQVRTYVEWVDHKGKWGRTEGDAANPHMSALLARATREGVPHKRETW